MVRRLPLRTLVAALLVGSLLGVVFAAPATASPRPVAVCAPCERSFVSAAHTNDVEVRIERSTATMRVHRNGSATWTVENRLNDTAALENASLRRSVAEEAVLVHDARLLSTSVSGDTVRMRYRTFDAATEAPGGVLRVTYFRDDPGTMVRSGLGADRLTLVAPERMTVGRALPGADVSNREMTVTSFEGGRDGPFVTLVPEGDPLAPLWSLAAVSLPLAPIVGRNLVFLVALPTLVFVGGLGVVAWAVSAAGLDPAAANPDRRALGVVVLALLALATDAFALGGVEPPLFAGAAGALALGGALAVPAVRTRLSVARLAGLVCLAFVVAVAVGVVLRSTTTLHVGDGVARRLLPTLPVYAATLVGYAAAHGDLRRALAAAAGALALVLGLSFPILSQGGTFYFLGVVVALIGAVAGVVVGTPFFLLGHGLAGRTTSDARAGAADD
jgi:hypothetical protein